MINTSQFSFWKLDFNHEWWKYKHKRNTKTTNTANKASANACDGFQCCGTTDNKVACQIPPNGNYAPAESLLTHGIRSWNCGFNLLQAIATSFCPYLLRFSDDSNFRSKQLYNRNNVEYLRGVFGLCRCLEILLMLPSAKSVHLE
jgi:hypothetical protein